MNTLALLGYKLERFITARWKAIAPLALFGATYAIQHGFDVDKLRSLTGLKEFVGIVVTSIAVHYTPNVATK